MDLTLQSGDGMLNIRVGAIIKSNNHYYFHYDKKRNYYALIGGRVKYFESSDSAIKREINEELGIECNEVQFVTTIQNFFEYQNTSIHEILFMYKLDLDEHIKTIPNNHNQNNIDYVYVNLTDIPELDIRPEKAKEIILKQIDIQPLFIDRNSTK